MAFSLQNITATENVISSLSDRPQMNSSALKDKFDQMGEELKSQINEYIIHKINNAIVTSISDPVTTTDEKLATALACKTYIDQRAIAQGDCDMDTSVFCVGNTSNTNKVDRSLIAEEVTAEALATIKLAMYPVGAVYTSVDSTSPATLFGGTWQRIGEGRVLVGVNSQDSDFNTSEKTGGAKTVILSVSQMPTHKHTASVTVASTTQSHSHKFHSTNPEDGYGLAQSASYTNTIMLEGTRDSWNTDGKELTHDHSATATINNSGSGSAHNNMPPYYAVYMWKRVS